MGARLYDELLSSCGLSPVLAADVIGRVCKRAGVNAETITRAQLAEAMSAFEKALGLYLGKMALKTTIDHLRALAATSEVKAAQ